MFLNWFFVTGEYWAGDYFCGLHGSASVDPDGEQIDFDHHGGCGFVKIEGSRQLVFPPV